MAALVLAGLALPAGPGAAAASNQLDLDMLQGFVFDQAHGKAFATGNTISTTPERRIWVTDLEGTPLRSIATVPLAGSMVMTPDNSQLVVANGDAITVIDAATEEIVKTVDTGADSCPRALAPAAGKIFFATGKCPGGTGSFGGDLGALDVATGVVTHGLKPTSFTWYPSMLSVPSAPNLLIAEWEAPEQGSRRVYVLDVTGGTSPSVAVRASFVSGFGAKALSPDGARLYLGSTGKVRVLSTATLAELRSYSISGDSWSVSERTDGTVAISAGTFDSHTSRTLRIYPKNSTTAVTSFPTRAVALEFGPKFLYALTATGQPGSERYEVKVFHPVPVANLTLNTDRSTYPWKGRATVTATLRGPTQNTHVRIYATPAGQAERLVRSGTVSPTSRGLTYVIPAATRNTSFRAVYDGDDDYRPATVTKAIKVRSTLTLSSASRSRTGIYHKLPARKAFVYGQVRGVQPRTCVYVTGYRYRQGKWRYFDLETCVRTDANGRIALRFVGFKRGAKLKVSAWEYSTKFNVGGGTKWYYVVLT